MVRRLEQGGEPLDFISIIEAEAESTKMNPVSTFQKVDLLLIIKKIFERYGLIKPPYPIWINDLREQLLTLNTIEDIK